MNRAMKPKYEKAKKEAIKEALFNENIRGASGVMLSNTAKWFFAKPVAYRKRLTNIPA